MSHSKANSHTPSMKAVLSVLAESDRERLAELLNEQRNFESALSKKREMNLLIGACVLAAVVGLLHLVGILDITKISGTYWLIISIGLYLYAVYSPEAEIHALNNSKEHFSSIIKQNLERARLAQAYWIALRPIEFEHEVALVYSRGGYTAEVTRATGDGGVDIVARKGDETLFIQCKAHRLPVGPGPVRELHGVVTSRTRAVSSVRGVLVSRSGFTEGAKKYAQQAKIELVTLDDLLTLNRRI